MSKTKKKKTEKKSPKDLLKALNPRETRIVKAIMSKGPLTLAELAATCFPGKGVKGITKGNSWARNSVRKPLKLRLIAKVEKGTYDKGKNAPARLSAPRKAAKKAKPAHVEQSAPMVAAEPAQASA